MRRSDEHIKNASEPSITRSGDQHIRGALTSDAIETYPDSANNWGKTPLDDDWQEES